MADVNNIIVIVCPMCMNVCAGVLTYSVLELCTKLSVSISGALGLLVDIIIMFQQVINVLKN